jgi:hypothetical protein
MKTSLTRPEDQPMERKEADQIIAILYGTDTETGRQLLHDLLEEMGLATLTDEAVCTLAGEHRRRHDTEPARLERRDRERW